MADFSLPVNGSLAASVLDLLKDQIRSVGKLFIGTVDSNIEDGFVRYDESSNHFQKKAGSTWPDLGLHAAITAEIAAAVSSGGAPTGTVVAFAGTTAPSGWSLCDGGELPRQSGSPLVNTALFNLIGTTWGVGNTTTTYNKPDLRQRFVLGKHGGTGAGSTLGTTSGTGLGGSIDHTHSTPNHQHTIPTHNHDIAHTHTTPAHVHTIPNHYHVISAHYHSVTGFGSTIAISSGGAHQHKINARTGAAAGTNADNTLVEASAAHNDTVVSVSDATSAHVHPHSDFTGLVGNTAGGRNGDDAFNSETDYHNGIDGSHSTNNGTGEGAGTTGAITSTNGWGNNTGPSGTLTSNSGEGAGTTGTNNPPYLTLNYIIKL